MSDPTHAGREARLDLVHAKGGHRVKERLVHEVRQFLFMFLYLYVLFGLFAIHEAVVLEQHHIAYAYYGFALVNALVLAKVMLVAEDLHLGRRFENRPLIYPVLVSRYYSPSSSSASGLSRTCWWGGGKPRRSVQASRVSSGEGS